MVGRTEGTAESADQTRELRLRDVLLDLGELSTARARAAEELQRQRCSALSAESANWKVPLFDTTLQPQDATETTSDYVHFGPTDVSCMLSRVLARI